VEWPVAASKSGGSFIDIVDQRMGPRAGTVESSHLWGECVASVKGHAKVCRAFLAISWSVHHTESGSEGHPPQHPISVPTGLPEGLERQQILPAFWDEIYSNPLTQAQSDYLTIRGQRRSEYICLLDEERAEGGSLLQVIRPTLPQRSLMNTSNQAMRSRHQDLFRGRSDLDAIEELERKSSLGTGLGGFAPQ
jgi:hypothetical protein